MELMAHQKYALERYIDASIIPLFFDAGTGKTLTATVIADAKYRKGYIDAVLVIAPNKVDVQWATRELPFYKKEGFLSPNATIYCNKKDKHLIPFKEGVLNIVCVNIDQFSTPTSFVRYVQWANAHRTMIILDEATRIKNPKSKRCQRLLYEFNDVVRRNKAILKSTPKSVARAILTGTPITNGPFDVWAMFEFLQPNYFNLNWYSFQNKFGMLHTMDVKNRKIRIPIGDKIWGAVRACSTFEQANELFGVSLDTYDVIRQQVKYEGPYKHVEYLRKLMMRDATFVRVEDITDMPERKYIKRLVDMSPEQERIYNELEADMIAEFKDKEVTATTKLTLTLRLQQVASGFVVPFYENEEDLEDPPPAAPQWIEETPTKMEMLFNDVEELTGMTLIIITRFSCEAQRIYEELVKQGHKVCLQTGWKTVGTISDFQDGKYDVMVANIRVISQGFNLQNAHYIMFYSNTFSLEDRIQTEARIYRKGQTNKCIYYDYITNNTVDMKVLAALSSKKNLSDYVRDLSAEECLVGWDQTLTDTFKEVIF